MTTDLIPADRNRCQVEITPAHGAFVLGPRPKPEQCTNKPAFIATENNPGQDGQRGSMSVCARCLIEFQKQFPPGYATLEPLTEPHQGVK